MTSRQVGKSARRPVEKPRSRGVEQAAGSSPAAPFSPPVILSEAKDLGAAYAKDEILRFAHDDGGRARDDEGRARDAICIAPAPTEQEAAAIVAALLLAEPVADAAHATDHDSPWAMAGRRAAWRGLDGGAAMGWGRLDGRRR